MKKGADMKIGEFAKKFDTSVSTVRHYINLGLLVPEKDGFQYCFEDDDCREMEIITTMKNAGFKLSELNKYLSIFRFYNKDDYLLYEKLLEYLRIKKADLYAERHRINTYIRLINKKIKEIEASSIYAAGKNAGSDDKSAFSQLPGFPLSAVDLLRCPHCQSRLHLSGIDITGDSITEGKLTCSCGYQAGLRNGIIFTDILKDLDNDDKFLYSYFGEENVSINEDGLLLMAIDEHSNEYMTNLHRSSLWIHKELENIDLNNKVILFPELSMQYLYSHCHDNLAYNSIFIVTSPSERTIQTMRQHIANAAPDLKIAYIINQDGKLPLRTGCIDAVIDYMGSCNLGFFEQKHYFDMISPYVADEAIIAGTTEYYRKGTVSLRRIHELYPDAAPDVFTLEFLNDALKSNGFLMKKSKKISEGYDPGRFFEYHVPGDIRTNIVYIASRDAGKAMKKL